MIAVIFFIAVLNLLLGFAAALFLEQSIGLTWPQMSVWLKRKSPPAEPRQGVIGDKGTALLPPDEAPPLLAETKSSAEPEPDQTTSVESAPAPEVEWGPMPDEWRTLLETEHLHPRSFVEAMLWVMRSEVPVHRKELTTASVPPNDSSITMRAALQRSVGSWHQKVMHWQEALHEFGSSWTQSNTTDEGDDLHGLLVEQSALIQLVVDRVEKSTESGSTAKDYQALSQPAYQAIQTTNAIGERIDEMLAVILTSQNRLTEVTDACRIDAATSLPNRLGLSVMLKEWQLGDPDRTRPVTGVMFEIDQFANFAERHGGPVTDKVILALGELMQNSIRNERGFDRIIRLAAQRYLIFFGDSETSNATTGAERIRQVVEGASFKYGGDEIRLTASCSVAEWKNESADDWLDRLRLLLIEAKRAGGNCTCLETDEGPQVLPADQTVVETQEVVLDQLPAV